MVRDAHFRCLKRHHLSQNTFTKMQTQGSSAKKFKPKKSRSKDVKLINEKTPAPPRTNKPEKTYHQDKKKEYFKKKRDQKNSTLAIGDNAIQGEKKQND